MLILNRKTRSFSLIEMLVVLILSGILSGIIFFCFYTIVSYEISLTRKLERVNDANTFYSNFSKDVKRCQMVQMQGNVVRCTYSQKEDVEYMFFSGYVLRTQINRIDTFACVSSLPDASFRGVRLINSIGYVDSLSLALKYEGRNKLFAVTKTYDRATLLQIVSKSE